jgi:hypothetical protein
MAEDQDLDFLRSVVTHTLTAPGRKTAQDGEGEPGQHGRRMVPMRWSESESEFWHPSRS